MNLTRYSVNRFFGLAVLAAAVLFTHGTVFGTPTPVVISGNPTCATLNALPFGAHGGAFDHMTENWGFKIDPTVAGVFPLVSASGKVVEGGMTPNANLFLNIALSSGTGVMSSWSLSWSSPSNLNRLVSAVIVKGGPQGANVYPYNPLDNGDVGPFITPGGHGISHLTFCFEPFAGPSAADAEIIGRVIDRAGRGISGAVMTIVNLNTGEMQYAVTNSFGYYGFKGLPVSNIYNLGVQAARYQFNDPVMTFQLDDSLADVMFVAR